MSVKHQVAKGKRHHFQTDQQWEDVVGGNHEQHRADEQAIGRRNPMSIFLRLSCVNWHQAKIRKGVD